MMNKREKTQIQRQVVLREAAMGAKPGPQERPKAFHGIDVYFIQAITIIIPGIFATTVAHTFMHIAPLFQVMY